MAIDISVNPSYSGNFDFSLMNYEYFNLSDGKAKHQPHDVISDFNGTRIISYLKKSSFTQSMSAKGNAYDNAVVESFFRTLKCETFYLQKVKSLSDLIRTIDEYIYWYNHKRIKLTLGGYSPIQYRLMNQ